MLKLIWRLRKYLSRDKSLPRSETLAQIWHDQIRQGLRKYAIQTEHRLWDWPYEEYEPMPLQAYRKIRIHCDGYPQQIELRSYTKLVNGDWRLRASLRLEPTGLMEIKPVSMYRDFSISLEELATLLYRSTGFMIPDHQLHKAKIYPRGTSEKIVYAKIDNKKARLDWLERHKHQTESFE